MYKFIYKKPFFMYRVSDNTVKLFFSQYVCKYIPECPSVVLFFIFSPWMRESAPLCILTFRFFREEFE